MKRLLLASFMLVSNLLTGNLFGADDKMGRKPRTRTAQSETAYYTATKKADQLLQEFARQSNAQDIANLAKYFAYYKSWGGYQAVTPAPRDLDTSLSAAARTLTQEIKQLADTHFMRKRSSVAGESSLTQKGDKFYRHVERQLQHLAQQKK